jgi:UDP-N-acetylglucosamine-lysosomal-enzyme
MYQVPHWLDTSHPKLVLVSHSDIFEDHSHLPTFSSPAIEANLHRIPGLSSQVLHVIATVL